MKYILTNNDGGLKLVTRDELDIFLIKNMEITAIGNINDTYKKEREEIIKRLKIGAPIDFINEKLQYYGWSIISWDDIVENLIAVENCLELQGQVVPEHIDKTIKTIHDLLLLDK